jgi:hypothetical protein
VRVSNRTAVILDAIEIAVHELAKLPDSPESSALRTKALAFEETAKAWPHAPPTQEKRGAMMQSVLALHVEVMKLVRAQAKDKPR